MAAVLEPDQPLMSSRDSPALVSQKGKTCVLVHEGCFHVYNRRNGNPERGVWNTKAAELLQHDPCHAVMDHKGNFIVRAGKPGQDGRVIWRAVLKGTRKGPFFGVLRDDGDFWLYAEAGPYWKASEAAGKGRGSVFKAPPLSKTAAGKR